MRELYDDHIKNFVATSHLATASMPPMKTPRLLVCLGLSAPPPSFGKVASFERVATIRHQIS